LLTLSSAHLLLLGLQLRLSYALAPGYDVSLVKNGVAVVPSHSTL
jgi:hypothetical protein